MGKQIMIPQNSTQAGAQTIMDNDLSNTGLSKS